MDLFSFKKVDRQSAVIHVLTKTPPTQRSRNVVRFMQNEPQFILYRAQRTNVNIQCWNTVDTSTLTMVEKWFLVWCFHDVEIMIVSCLFPSPHSIYWITIMIMQLNQRLHSRWTDAIIHGWKRTLSLVEKFWTRSLLLDTYIMPNVCECMYRWCGVSQNSVRGYTKCIWTTAGMLYRDLIILWMDFGYIW